jgi:hypothetical protein
MTDSIMRGVDKWGRIFFTIKVKVEDNDSQYQHCQTFFQRYDDALEWAHGIRGIDIIPFTGRWIDHSGKVNENEQKSYALLKTLISEGKIIRGNTTYTLA